VSASEPTAGRAASDAVNRFTADLLKRVAAEGDNLFVSPYSIATALAMTRAGANGETAKQIDAVFHLPADAAAGFRELTAALANVPTEKQWRGQDNPREAEPVYALSIANGLFVQKGFPIRDAFRGTLATDYAAEFRDLDFRGDAAGARKTINGWVEEKTKQRIKDIVPEGLPTPDTKMALANAIWFKAQWAEAFREPATEDGPFTVSASKSVTAKRMSRVDSMAYLETGDAQAVEIPYRGGATSMIVVLPRAKDGLDALVKGLTPERLAALQPGKSWKRVLLKLPKFEFTTPLDVKSTLSAMGMPLAFDEKRADFSGISDAEPLVIGSVLHKAFVAVDENGTEAAAATVVLMVPTSAAPGPRDEPVPFVVDHPFLFLIRHNATGVILFAGRVVDPTAR
jgi:serpin B